MSTFKLLRAEIGHRKANFLLSVLALVAAATLFVASPLLMNGYGRESNKRLKEKQEQTEAELAKLRKQNSDDLNSMQAETAAEQFAILNSYFNQGPAHARKETHQAAVIPVHSRVPVDPLRLRAGAGSR